MIVGTNCYRWIQHYSAAGQSLEDHYGAALSQALQAGIEAWEPFWETERHRDLVAEKLPEVGVRFLSYYTPVNLLGGDLDAEIGRVLERASWARELGATIAVTNPDPVNWNGTPKPDDVLRRQTDALKILSAELYRAGTTLAYHFHTPELLMGARELHLTMLDVPAEHLKLCLDAHWTYRGCGNSHVALETVVRQYADRIATLHVRQSVDGVWSETLHDDGDIDYGWLFRTLKASGWDGLACVELATEAGTPSTMDLGEAHAISSDWLREAWSQA